MSADSLSMNGSNYLSADYIKSETADKVYNENGKVISEGEEKSRLHFKGFDNKIYWVAVESGLKLGKPHLSKAPKSFRRTAILTFRDQDGRDTYVEVNIRSISKRLGISLDAIKEEMDRKDEGHVYGDITGLVRENLENKLLEESVKANAIESQALAYVKAMKLISEGDKARGMELLKLCPDYPEANYQIAVELLMQEPQAKTDVEIDKYLKEASGQGHPLAAYEYAKRLPPGKEKSQYFDLAVLHMKAKIQNLIDQRISVPDRYVLLLAEMMAENKIETNPLAHTNDFMSKIYDDLFRMSKELDDKYVAANYLLGRHLSLFDAELANHYYGRAADYPWASEDAAQAKAYFELGKLNSDQTQLKAAGDFGYSRGYFELGEIARKNNNIPKAQEYYEKAAAGTDLDNIMLRDGERANARAYYWLGNITSNDEEALEYFQKAVDLDLTEAYLPLAKLQIAKDKRDEKALTNLEVAMERGIKESFTFYALIQTLIYKDLEKAEQTLLNLNTPAANVERLRIYLASDPPRLEEAREVIKRADKTVSALSEGYQKQYERLRVNYQQLANSGD